ncbi:hypothetical protein [Proteiniphilum sp.]|jgi:hypothetical protein|uniref:hypothetical protein n=1 Tax=Proteiniphilum sp. TaxID=1926877 RepID=UPI0026938DFA|nr:hypothetical protein [Proteiniphilum sp.]MEA5127516.1 hypothetical protein [Proteiniphilum sp.]
METKEQIKRTNEVDEIYEKPTIEVIEMEMEGILCASSDGDGFGDGGGGLW